MAAVSKYSALWNRKLSAIQKIKVDIMVLLSEYIYKDTTKKHTHNINMTKFIIEILALVISTNTNSNIVLCGHQ